MSRARLITIGAATLDDAAARVVARTLGEEGVPVTSREVVDEDEAALVPALEAAVAEPGLVVLLDSPGGSGGEIARRAIARLAGVRLILNDTLLALLREDSSRRGQAMPRRLDRLALLPQGAEPWPGPGGAPGWSLETRGAVIAVLPLGADSLPALVEGRLRPLARRRSRGAVSLIRTLHTTGIAPAEVEERLGPWLGREGSVAVSTRVTDGDVSVRLALHRGSREAAERDLARTERVVREALGDDCYGRDGETLEAVVGALLVKRRLTVSVAESCTGGLLAHRLTGIPGSARYFERGVIAYANSAKGELLGVSESLVSTHGAVSAPVARAMALGLAPPGGARCRLAVTGLAGPGGGSADKPVGTAFIACSVPAGPDATPAVEIRRFRSGGRGAVQWQSTQAALDMLRRALGRRSPRPS